MACVLSSTLQGAVVLITGAAGEIGRAACGALSAAGARIIATDLGAVPAGMQADTWLQHDVTSQEDWARVAGEIQRRYGRLDCLINSAGICPFESIANISLEQWRKVSSVNVESVLLGLQATLPLLRKSGEERAGGASVVNLSSAAGLRGCAFVAAYSASKGAVTLLTKSAAKEFAALRYPIRVNSIHPGSVDSPMMEANLRRFVEIGAASSVEAARDVFTSMHPMGRFARAEEIAGGIVFLCSPAASYMTGCELVIDGGALA